MPEQQNIEWKISWRDEFLKWICGFANAKGGQLFIGKDDNGNIVGIDNYKRLLDDLPNKIQNHLGILCEVNLHDEGSKYYIEIVVNPYDTPISYQGKYHYRSGSTKQELKGNELNEFLLKKSGKTWGDIIEQKATFADIDENSVEVFKKEAVRTKRLPAIEREKDIKQIFRNLRLVEDDKLKRAAVLLFGKEPCNFYINAYAKIGKFGNSDHDLQSQEIIEGSAFLLADKIIEILDKKYFIKAISYDKLHRVETPPYPYEAIREALINAIIHRNYFGPPIQISLYDNKIMIWNVGELPRQLSITDLKTKHSSYPKNQILADVFFKGGLIEAWGRGTLKIINECIKFGLPEPDIEILSGGICVTMYKNKLDEKFLSKLLLNERQKKAIKYLKVNERITNREYQELSDCSNRTASRDLSDMIKKKIIESSDKKGAGTFYQLIRTIKP
ncbi:MAG: transcriptional regulator [Bacteroidetes bacterium]|jgi:ATP-dependent DNA helicase RecG|nr:transcriptional regulator [Bacteroidota bacterium]MBT6686871.1 transcriptional regulator [Bacteroidota bacterium]MBT7145129.1 transcriptional regulator [Bacteroidota bacterium]MBT7493316.1 transcriptional regulator [Bacteroidota bacterium]